MRRIRLRPGTPPGASARPPLEAGPLPGGAPGDRIPGVIRFDAPQRLDRLAAAALERVAQGEPQPGLPDARRVGVLVEHALEVHARRVGELELEVEPAGIRELARQPRARFGDAAQRLRVEPVPGVARQIAAPLLERLGGELLVEVARPRLADQRLPQTEGRRAAGVALGVVAQQALELDLGRRPLPRAEVAHAETVDGFVHVPAAGVVVDVGLEQLDREAELAFRHRAPGLLEALPLARARRQGAGGAPPHRRSQGEPGQRETQARRPAPHGRFWKNSATSPTATATTTIGSTSLSTLRVGGGLLRSL